MCGKQIKKYQTRLPVQTGYPKVYGHLNFLIHMLQKIGFGTRWIKHCISIVKFFDLINRDPSGFFPSLRGLRQGDPPPPLMFILTNGRKEEHA